MLLSYYFSILEREISANCQLSSRVYLGTTKTNRFVTAYPVYRLQPIFTFDWRNFAAEISLKTCFILSMRQSLFLQNIIKCNYRSRIRVPERIQSSHFLLWHLFSPMRVFITQIAYLRYARMNHSLILASIMLLSLYLTVSLFISISFLIWTSSSYTAINDIWFYIRIHPISYLYISL